MGLKALVGIFPPKAVRHFDHVSPAVHPGMLIVPGTTFELKALCNNSGQAKTHYSEFGPRFGFAWAPDLGLGNLQHYLRGDRLPV